MTSIYIIYSFNFVINSLSVC